MPGSQHGPSILNPKVYEALRRKGMSKTRAARISNAQRHKESAATGLAIPPHGPNALFNQPGLQSSRRRRKRLKATPKWNARAGETIIGGLARGEGGRFSSSGQPSSRSTNSAARRERATARREARLARAEAMKAAQDEAKAAEEETRAEEDAYIAAGATGHERQKRRAEIAAARRERASARKAANAEAVANEKAIRAKEDEDEAAARAAEDAAPKAGGGGGGGKKKPSEEEKKAEAERKKAKNRAETAPKAGLSPEEAEFLAGVASGSQPPGSFDAKRLMAWGLVADAGDTSEATDAGRRAIAALERGDVRGALAAIQDGKAKVARDAAKRQRDEEKKKRDEEKRAGAADKKKPTLPGYDPRRNPPRPPVAAQPDPAVERARNRTLADQIIRNLSERRQRRRRKSAPPAFTVFKDASGRDRWAAITTTAYEDKDREWISCKAIRSVVEAGPHGPLRFWHVPGLDLGDCDYQAALDDGRLLLESGTFRSKAAAAVGVEAARRGYQMSPGFVHSRREPRAGVFDHIAIFERSFVPPGRASNPYTRLLTKEMRMLTKEKRAEFEALAGDDEGRALLAQLLAQADTTTKAADAAGAVYKDAPAWAQALITRLDALEATVKAPMPPEEMIEAGATELEDGEADVPIPGAEAEGVADDLMDDEGFANLIVEKLVAALGPMLDLEKKMTGYLGEMKAMLQPAAPLVQKDDTQAQTIAALEARLKSLEGEQPRSLHAGVWGDLTGIKVTPEQAAQITAKQAAAAPAGLTPQEQGAYALIFGEQ